MDTNDRLLSLREVIEITSFSRSSIYGYIKKAQFPKAVHVGQRKVAWIKAEIDAWVAGKVAARDDAANAALPTTTL